MSKKADFLEKWSIWFCLEERAKEYEKAFKRELNEIIEDEIEKAKTDCKESLPSYSSM
jgi:hypothetical protein